MFVSKSRKESVDTKDDTKNRRITIHLSKAAVEAS